MEELLKHLDTLQKVIQSPVDEGELEMIKSVISGVIDVVREHISASSKMSLEQRLEEMRSSLISEIQSGDTKVPLEHNAKVVIQLVPESIAKESNKYNVHNTNLALHMQTLTMTGLDYRHLVNGFMTMGKLNESERYHGYVYLDESGFLESVDTFTLRDPEYRVPAPAFEVKMIQAIKNNLVALQQIGIDTPIRVVITMTSVRPFRVIGANHEMGNSFDFDTFEFPVVTIESFTDDVGKVLKPVFDKLWNASGFVGCPNYNADGEYIGRR